MTAKTSDAKTELTPCACQHFEIEIWNGEVPEGADPADYVDYVGTGCSQKTRRTFAPGHDAKLKGLLIQAGADGHGVRREVGGMASIGKAEKIAEAFGFEHQVKAGIQRLRAQREAKAAKKAEKPAAKAPRTQKQQKAEKIVGITDPATIKVGRWTYEAVIDTKTNAATFTSANGETKTVAEGKYKLVGAK